MPIPPLPTELNSSQELEALWKGYRQEVLECINKTPDDKFLARPESGGWSISEIGEHIYLSQWNIVRAIPAILAGKFGVETDEQLDKNYREMRAGLGKPRGFKNPESVSPLSNYSKSQLLPLLEKSEKKLEDGLKSRTKADLQKRGLEHPAFGILNMFNFLWVMSLHENLHLYSLKDKTAKL
jgi:uncharacterized damage-inducible protein DinB